MLRETYQAVGVINPRFHEFDAPEQKLRTARGLLPDDMSYERVISVITSVITGPRFWLTFRRSAVTSSTFCSLTVIFGSSRRKCSTWWKRYWD
jgi:hypothetical protein